MGKTVILKCEGAKSFCSQSKFIETHVRFFAKGLFFSLFTQTITQLIAGSSDDGEEIYPLGAEIVEVNIQTVARLAADKLAPANELSGVQFNEQVSDGKFQPQVRC